MRDATSLPYYFNTGIDPGIRQTVPMTAVVFMHVGAVQAYSSRLAVNFARATTMVIRFLYLRSGVSVAPCWLFQLVVAGKHRPLFRAECGALQYGAWLPS